jgi:hypothetical protein
LTREIERGHTIEHRRIELSGRGEIFEQAEIDGAHANAHRDAIGLPEISNVRVTAW